MRENFLYICNMWGTRGDVHVAHEEVIVTVERQRVWDRGH